MDSPNPQPDPAGALAPELPPWRRRLRLPAGLFLATAASTLLTGANAGLGRWPTSLAELWTGWTFAVPLLAILLAHEFGHYIAARLHRVPASLPHFIPLPFVGLFGTLGAVIGMPERIRSRNALLDIGAAGPLAGLVVALPVLWVGLQASEVRPLEPGYLMEGQSLAYLVIKRLALGPMPEGHDVYLHPAAFAGWGGLFLTLINLLPWGQLDGGHIAYAWLGERLNRVAGLVRRAVLLLFAYNAVLFIGPLLLGQSQLSWGEAISSSSFWLVWFGVLTLLKNASGEAHPPCDFGKLGRGRQAIAALCLLLFALLFMPTPVSWT